MNIGANRFTILLMIATALSVASCSSGSGVPGLDAGDARAGTGERGAILFASDRDGNTEIYVMNADGTAQTRLTTNTAADHGPSWSPDRSRIASSAIATATRRSTS